MAKGPKPTHSLTFSNFSPVDYPHLPASTTIKPSRAAIERALLMVGYPSRFSATSFVGPWRAKMLSNLVQGYLDDVTLGTTDYFRNLEPSERSATSFLLGQAFTYWAAQRFLDIQLLVHVSGSAVCTPAPKTSKKPGAGKIKDKGVPDFIGLAPGEFHIFESKGRSLPTASTNKPSTVADKCLPGALAQASRIATVMGSPPKTCTASVWVFTEDGPHGWLVDPSAAPESAHLAFDPMAAIRRAYRFLLDLPPAAETADLVTVAVEDRLIGADRRLFEMLFDGGLEGQEGAQEVLSYLAKQRTAYAEASTEGVDFGPDGVFVSVPLEEGLTAATPSLVRRTNPPQADLEIE